MGTGQFVLLVSLYSVFVLLRKEMTHKRFLYCVLWETRNEWDIEKWVTRTLQKIDHFL